MLTLPLNLYKKGNNIVINMGKILAPSPYPTGWEPPIKKALYILSMLGGVWMVGVRGYIGP